MDLVSVLLVDLNVCCVFPGQRLTVPGCKLSVTEVTSKQTQGQDIPRRLNISTMVRFFFLAYIAEC